MEEEKIIEYMLTKKYDENNYNCWHFAQEVYKDMYGFDLPDYPMGEVPSEFKNRLKSNINHKKIDAQDAVEGDIIIFSLFSEQHAGIMLNNDDFIHMGTKSVTVSQLSNIGGNYAIYRVVR